MVRRQANKDNANFDMEMKQLSIEIKRANDKSIDGGKGATAPSPDGGDFMERLRLRKEFEENFTRTLRDLRKELEQVLSDPRALHARNRMTAARHGCCRTLLPLPSLPQLGPLLCFNELFSSSRHQLSFNSPLLNIDWPLLSFN